jgi:hypothetical protein
MKKLLIISTLSLTLIGCAHSPVNGMITMVKWDGGVSNPEVSSIKTGKSCAKSILGVFASGDASIETAKKNGGISRVASVDHETTNIMHFYGQYCTIVTGE